MSENYPDGLPEGLDDRDDWSESETEQLDPEDTLIDRGLADPLDEGYDPPERPRTNHFGETEEEEREGESLDQRLAEEEPEEWDEEPVVDEGRAGRLAEDDDAAGGRDNDVYGVDEGISGAGASAEEAAVHYVEDDEG
ncbi:DUF5709 domain-containing protein [Luteimicrobium xylanilyticum]|uniref:DUF5709 domain-containing protein n=1 Tax=Luteimicrobium xylanilyticum TaxID=1133546 RepID=A0A5P9Q7G0_9MICO|nr:DUF5709 domain-containing protein [Luteimicrobium xylanilyticum]QFU97351.1 hypothetical protein KDY119_00849 [Luteimicrobium xylanilyticum]